MISEINAVTIPGFVDFGTILQYDYRELHSGVSKRRCLPGPDNYPR